MATKAYGYGPNGRYERGRWRARVKMNWTEYFLGLFDSKDEAEEREREFRNGSS